MIALVAGDGRRRVVWGIGATPTEATADLGDDGGDGDPLVAHGLHVETGPWGAR